MSDDHEDDPSQKPATGHSAQPERPPVQKRVGSSDRSDDRPGYRNPPRHTRFKKGQSGNPGGQSKKNTVQVPLAELLEDIGSTVIPARGQNGERIEVTLIEALLTSQYHAGAKGDSGAARNILRLLEKTGVGKRRRMTNKEYTDREIENLTPEELRTVEEIQQKLGHYFTEGEAPADDGETIPPEFDDDTPLSSPWHGDEDQGE